MLYHRNHYFNKKIFFKKSLAVLFRKALKHCKFEEGKWTHIFNQKSKNNYSIEIFFRTNCYTYGSMK